MPGAQVVAVVLVERAAPLAEEVVVALGVLRREIVVAGGRVRALDEAAPARPVALLELAQRAVLVGVVAERGNCRVRMGCQDLRGLLVALVAALRDVPGCEQGRRGRDGRGRLTSTTARRREQRDERDQDSEVRPFT